MTAANILIFTSILVVALWLYQLRRSPIAWIWSIFIFAIPLYAAHTGILARFDVMPPPVLLFVLYVGVSAYFIAFSSLGREIVKKVSLSSLVLFQSFRILAEAVIYLGVLEGIAPKQLSFEGYNFDIVTGVSALLLGLYLRKRASPTLVTLFSMYGFICLIIIAFIALTSMPNALRVFMTEPTNLWVTGNPYVLLPGVLVLAAWAGQLLILRKMKV